MTLNKENTRLRTEYEDILRFYGFDLSSIEQEANVTVSMGDSSDTTELPTSTTGSTIPTEMIDTRNEPDITTVTLTTTTLPSETMIAPSIAEDVTQGITIEAIDVQSTVANPEAAIPSTSSTVDSSSVVTSDEDMQLTSMRVTVDSQTNPIMVSADDQSPQATSTVAGTDEIVADTIIPNAATESANSNANIQVPHDLDTANANAMRDEMPTNISPTTTIVDATPINDTPVTVNINTVTSNSLISTISSLANVINLTTPSPVIEAMTNNSVFLQSGMTSMGALPDGNISGIITPMYDVAITPIIGIDDDITAVTTITSSTQAINTTTLSDLVGDLNDSAIASTEGNIVSMNRKKKESEPDLKVIINDGTVKDELTNRKSSNLRKRRARNRRGYFSSYPGTFIFYYRAH